MAPTRWGIAGCGKISSDFVNAVQHLNDPDLVVVAVAARSVDSAQKFAEKFNVKKFYGSYQALAEDPEVDVVYIGVINTTHLSVGQAILAGGKNVLMEKPLAVNLQQTQQLIAEAKACNVFFMEALWSRFIPTYTEVRARLQRQEIGQVMHAFVSFGVPIADVPRLKEKELGGGCVIDIGVYAINFLLWVFDEEKPIEIKTMGTLNDQGLEMEVTAILKFSNNRFGTIVLSTSALLPNEAHVSGTKGTITLRSPFWAPPHLTSPSGNFDCPLDPSERKYEFGNSQFLKYEAQHIASCLEKGVKESPVMPHSSSLLLAEVMQDIRQQLGSWF
ncbi:trans-1,2-dihydrobenzene-1,2-diol dehydrogenase [Hyalella azteca]|uniref:Trans-1,2-dihydrobenzene-1,2-diol dehydrogenase n=1 Tax=Hyalella azteca TaxID=294128 RepID=A0A8B7PM98_HYAAZ|nr:trans-1,2-dihydrobenzene-1,2-diol dehydrogenase [Hyalella azteca]